MTREEVVKIIRIITSSYPNWKPENMSFTVDTWNSMLSDYTYKEISLALKTYITTDSSGFAPSIGQLISKLQTIAGQNELNEMDACSTVSKALRNGYYGAEEEFAKLLIIVQKAVGNPSQLRNWSQTNQESIENVVQSNFIRTYRAEVKKESEYKRMTNNVKDLNSETKNKMIGG